MWKDIRFSSLDITLRSASQFANIFIYFFYRRPLIDLLRGVPWMKQSIHLNRSQWDWRLSDWLLEDWQVSIIFHKKVAGSPLCDMEASERLLSISLPVSFAFLTPLLFKQTSEHLNDQNSATWLSAPVLSNLDGYVSVSERSGHVGCTHTYTDSLTGPLVQHRSSRQANASWHSQRLSQAEKWKNVLLGGDAVSHPAVQKQQRSL